MSVELHLVHQSDMGAVTATRLQEGDHVVGRLLENQLCLLDPSVSRFHAKIEVRGNQVTVTDLDSANGTFVNHQRIQKSRLLPGQEVRFGSLRFLLTSSESAPSTIDVTEDTMSEDEAKRMRAMNHPCVSKLTEGEIRVYLELITLKTEQKIADDLHLAKVTVHNHAKAIFIAFGVHTKAELIRKVMTGET